MSNHEYLTDFIIAFVCSSWKEAEQAIYWLDHYEEWINCTMPHLWQWKEE